MLDRSSLGFQSLQFSVYSRQSCHATCGQAPRASHCQLKTCGKALRASYCRLEGWLRGQATANWWRVPRVQDSLQSTVISVRLLEVERLLDCDFVVVKLSIHSKQAIDCELVGWLCAQATANCRLVGKSRARWLLGYLRGRIMR